MQQSLKNETQKHEYFFVSFTCWLYVLLRRSVWSSRSVNSVSTPLAPTREEQLSNPDAGDERALPASKKYIPSSSDTHSLSLHSSGQISESQAESHVLRKAERSSSLSVSSLHLSSSSPHFFPYRVESLAHSLALYEAPGVDFISSPSRTKSFTRPAITISFRNKKVSPFTLVSTVCLKWGIRKKLVTNSLL